MIGCAVELKMTMDDTYREQVLAPGENGKTYTDRLIYKTVSNNVRTLLGRLNEKRDCDMIFREEAQRLAEERLENPVDIWL